MLAKQLQMW